MCFTFHSYCIKNSIIYRPRRPEQTTLHQIVKKYYLPWSISRGDSVSRHVAQEFQGYLQCGILANGFAYAHCESCHEAFLIAFSCKGRGVCPSCNQRNMVEVAKRLVETLMPPQPIRQWVISFPKRLRCYLDDNCQSNVGIRTQWLFPQCRHQT